MGVLLLPGDRLGQLKAGWFKCIKKVASTVTRRLELDRGL